MWDPSKRPLESHPSQGPLAHSVILIGTGKWRGGLLYSLRACLLGEQSTRDWAEKRQTQRDMEKD